MKAAVLCDNSAAEQIGRHLAAGDLTAADALLAEVTASLATASAPQSHRTLAAIAPQAAELHLRRHRYEEAAAAFDRIENPDLSTRLKRNTARNFASLRKHRPQDYQRLAAATLSPRYRIVPGVQQRLVIADCRNPAKPVLLTANGDPVRAVHETITRLADRMKDGGPIGIVGVGDGYLLGTLARITPKLYMDMQQCVFLFEPDLSLLLLCLTLHDLSGPHGPIEQLRFQWFIGDGFAERFAHAINDDLLLPPPASMVAQGSDRQAIMDQIQPVTQDLQRRHRGLIEQVWRYYDTWNHLESAAAFDSVARFANGSATDEPPPLPAQPHRRPRVLLLTSRFTTVLQYAMRDAAAALSSIGCEARLMIEPTTHHAVTQLSIHQAMAEFKPDLVLQVDHLRHEHKDTFPPSLPFACWLQDHMPQLTDVKAGRQVGMRDYVLTFAAPLFTDTYEYPPRQCIDMPMMLTSPRHSPPQPWPDAPNLVYVSNVSYDPATLPALVLERTPAPWRDIASECCRRITGLYTEGRSMTGRYELRRMISQVTAEQSAQPDAVAVSNLVERLWNPLNITLYRQQALAWAADAAKHLGLTLGIYGKDWHKHPRFAPHARGVIENGEPLARLTHSAKINLNLEPYVCFTHQRLLDGLAAGGFFIVRNHPGNTLLQELCNLLEQEIPGKVETADEARRAAPPAIRQRLNTLLEEAATISFNDSADAVRQVRCWQRAGVLIPQPQPLPKLSEVTFDTPANCRQLIERFIGDAAMRQSIARQQRTAIEDRLSFAAGMRLMLSRIAGLLRTEPKPANSAAA